MNKLFKKAAATALSMCMVVSMGAMSAFAANTYEDGDYTATIAMLHETKDQPSMCNAMFDREADVTVKGDQATIRLYVANPVPGFPDVGADGTVKNVKLTLDGQQIPAVSDMESKPLREMDETNDLFGVKDGQTVSCQVLTFTVPTAKLDAMVAAPTNVDAYVNVVMMTDVVFRLKLDSITSNSAAPEEATKSETKSMQVTAEIAAPEAKYTVTIPESVTLGTLSTDKLNSQSYDVAVTASNLGNGRVVVKSAAEGALQSGVNSLAYTNTFGEQSFTQNGTLRGAFEVTGEAVAAAAAGNYTGTVTFDISYFAGK